MVCKKLSLLIFLFAATAAFAQTDSSPEQSKGTEPLKGEADVVVVTLSDLRDVGSDLEHLRNAANQLYGEVTLQRVTVQTIPTLVGPGSVVNLPIGFMPTGEYIPPRTRRVVAAMNEIRPIATLLKADLDSFKSGQKQLVLPGETAEVFNEQMQQWSVEADNIYGQLQLLEHLCAHHPYDQGAMAQATWAIVEDSKDLERIRRAMYKALQREVKRAAARR